MQLNSQAPDVQCNVLINVAQAHSINKVVQTISMERFFFCERTRHDSLLSEVLKLPRDLFDARQTASHETP